MSDAPKLVARRKIGHWCVDNRESIERMLDVASIDDSPPRRRAAGQEQPRPFRAWWSGDGLDREHRAKLMKCVRGQPNEVVGRLAKHRRRNKPSRAHSQWSIVRRRQAARGWIPGGGQIVEKPVWHMVPHDDGKVLQSREPRDHWQTQQRLKHEVPEVGAATQKYTFIVDRCRRGGCCCFDVERAGFRCRRTIAAGQSFEDDASVRGDNQMRVGKDGRAADSPEKRIRNSVRNLPSVRNPGHGQTVGRSCFSPRQQGIRFPVGLAPGR